MGMLQKFAAGAAGGIAEGLKLTMVDEQKSRLQSARDARLEKNKSARLEKQITSREGIAERGITSREKIASSKTLAPTANKQDVKSMVASGLFKTEKEAWDSIKGPNKGLLVPMFKMIVKRQEDDFLLAPEDRLTPEEMMAEARRLIAAKPKAPEATEKGGPPPAEEVEKGLLDRFSDYLFGGEDAPTSETAAPVTSAQYKTKEEVRNALRSGAIDRPEAMRLLEQFGYK